jgi:tetratricopeptide (TPR) repeat protein
MKLIKAILFSYLLLHTIIAWPEAYIPSDDAGVLEKLPVATAEKKRLRSLQIQANNNPKDYPVVLNLARNYIELGRTHSDPRYYSYAEALLTPWVTEKNAQPEALVLKATILQNRHDFKTALANLKAALKLNPRLPDAWLTLAAIYEVQGEYRHALRSCLALVKFSTSLASTACINSALSLSGQALTAYKQLTAAVTDAHEEPAEMTWAFNILAELAERLNLDLEAEGWYHKALAQNYRSVYLLSCYADFLLDHHRFEEVFNLLKHETQVDALLLRLALAEQQLHHDLFEDHADLIKSKIAAAKARGDTIHQGDESRFTLQILNEPKTALSLAISNWAVQKEPRDARILLEAAITAKKYDVALPVIEFLEQTHLEDARLQPLLKLVKG